MITDARPARPRSSMSRGRAAQLLGWFVFGVLPAITLLTLFVTTIQDDAVAFDFRVFYAAAEATRPIRRSTTSRRSSRAGTCIRRSRRSA